MLLDEVKEQMQRGASLLVPTQRAARTWRTRLFDSATHTALPTILPWGAWTAAQWHTLLLHGRDDRILLNPVQNTELWTGVLQNDAPGTLRPIQSLVRLCIAAEHLLHSYGAAEAQLRFRGEPGTDTAVFADWFRAYTDACQRERLLPASALDDALGRAIRAGGPVSPDAAPLFLLGFDGLLPAQQYLLDQLAATGTPVRTLDPGALAGITSNARSVVCCTDLQHERSTLAQHVLAAPAGTHTLVVLPDVEGSRPALDRSLRAMAPDTLWEFAAGRPLPTLPLTATALHLLRWTTGTLPVQAVADLLQSPYLHLGIDRERAGELDAEVLRDSRRLRPDWSIAALAHQVRTREPHLQEALLRLQATAAQQLRGDHLPGAWSPRVQQVLQAAGWPGLRERDSIEFQLVQRWNELLESLATLDLFDRPLPFAGFLQRLELTAADTLFAPENTGAAIQIVSPAEAAGTTADHLWFAHATENAWNARRTPSPLLPFALQRDCGMPGTDAARDADHHRIVSQRLLSSAATVTVSYAAMDSNGELQPAAIFHDIADRERADPPALLDRPAELETFVDDAPLPPMPEGVVHGGVGVLKDQAACAFRAFAQRRLFSTEPDDVTLGYNPRQRGDLLHKVLQLFWKETQTQAKLLQLKANGTLPATLQKHIDAALAMPSSGDSWNTAYLDLQRRRLLGLLLRWLDVESKRPPFTVLHTEHEVKDVEVGPLHFDLRVDRIDEVEVDGNPTLALIDYKTGTPKTSEWKGPRPGEPQLPLYAVAARLENVGAIAFATVRPGEKQLSLSALPRDTELLFAGKHDKKPEEFEQQMEEWYTTMQTLGEQFARGDARVGPKQYPGTCEFCGQRMLCRLDPELLQELGSDDEATPESSA